MPKDIADHCSAHIQAVLPDRERVIHSAHNMLGAMHQTNFYDASGEFRLTWLQSILLSSLVAVVVSMVLIHIASNKLLILDLFVDVSDLDLEIM